MPTNVDWLQALLGGVGQAFTGYGVGQDRRAAEAERARLAERQNRLDADAQFTTRLNQRGALEELGYRPTAQMAVPRATPNGMPGSLGAVPVDAMVGTLRRGDTLATPQGESFTLDRLQTPGAVRERARGDAQREARAELDRRARERKENMDFEASESAKARAAAEARASAQEKRGLSAAQTNTAANLLAARYDADPIVKNAKDVAQSLQRVMVTRDDAAGDLSLIFAYMKMLDPGSVVREGEFANAQNAAGIPDQIRNVYNRAMQGERLNPNQREQFRAQAMAIADGQRQMLRRTRERYATRAVPLGVDPDLYFDDPFIGFGLPSDKPEQGQRPTSAGPATGADLVRSMRGGRP